MVDYYYNKKLKLRHEHEAHFLHTATQAMDYIQDCLELHILMGDIRSRISNLEPEDVLDIDDANYISEKLYKMFKIHEKLHEYFDNQLCFAAIDYAHAHDEYRGNYAANINQEADKND